MLDPGAPLLRPARTSVRSMALVWQVWQNFMLFFWSFTSIPGALPACS